MKKYKEIQFFAVLREKIGDEIQIELEEKTSAAKLLNQLSEKFRDVKAVLESSRVANDDAILDESEIIDTSKTISILPPASGG